MEKIRERIRRLEGRKVQKKDEDLLLVRCRRVGSTSETHEQVKVMTQSEFERRPILFKPGVIQIRKGKGNPQKLTEAAERELVSLLSSADKIRWLEYRNASPREH